MGKFTFFHFQDKKLNDERFLQAESFLEKKGRKFYCEFVKEKLFLWKYVARTTKNE